MLDRTDYLDEAGGKNVCQQAKVVLHSNGICSDPLLSPTLRTSQALALLLVCRFVQGALHTVIVSSVGYLWFWHLGEIAAKQRIAQKYGWFFNYMTFVTLTLQLIQYMLALPVELFKKVPVSSPASILYCSALRCQYSALQLSLLVTAQLSTV